MTLVGFKGRNHPQQVEARGADDTVDDRETGPDTWAECHERWGPFNLDVAAAPHNAKCERFYTLQDDALTKPWDAESVWCNPPYSGGRHGPKLDAWMLQALGEWSHRRFKRLTMLLPANRTEQTWWQNCVEPYRDCNSDWMRTHYLRGRRRFIQAGATEIKPNERKPFGLVVITIGAAYRAPAKETA